MPSPSQPADPNPTPIGVGPALGGVLDLCRAGSSAALLHAIPGARRR